VVTDCFVTPSRHIKVTLNNQFIENLKISPAKSISIALVEPLQRILRVRIWLDSSEVEDDKTFAIPEAVLPMEDLGYPTCRVPRY
jgi:hypothetical protein